VCRLPDRPVPKRQPPALAAQPRAIIPLKGVVCGQEVLTLFDHIKIEGFRSFKKVELDLAPLSVLIGPNNGGKSNFLDLMSLMAEAGQGQLEEGIDSRGGFRGIASGFRWLGEVVIEFRFQAERLRRFSPYLEIPPLPGLPGIQEPDIRYMLAIASPAFGTSRVQVEEATERVLPHQPRPEVLMTRGKDGCAFRFIDPATGLETQESKALESESELAIFQVRDLYRFPILYKLLKQFQEWTLYRDINVGPEAPMRLPRLVRPTVRLAPDGGNLSSVLNSIQQQHPGVWDEIVELLRIAYPDFKTITFPPEGGDGKVVLRWWESPFEKEGVSANFLSDGTLKFLCLVAILKSPDPPPLICIDEPEIGLHPDWIKLVAEMMQSAAARTQVIVATHSPQIIAELDPEQVIVTEKENGETRLNRLERRDLEKWLKNFNLSELWLAGHFGGLP